MRLFCCNSNRITQLQKSQAKSKRHCAGTWGQWCQLRTQRLLILLSPERKQQGQMLQQPSLRSVLPCLTARAFLSSVLRSQSCKLLATLLMLRFGSHLIPVSLPSKRSYCRTGSRITDHGLAASNTFQSARRSACACIVVLSTVVILHNNNQCLWMSCVALVGEGEQPCSDHADSSKQFTGNKIYTCLLHLDPCPLDLLIYARIL